MADTPHPDTPAAPAATPRAALRVRLGSADRVPRVFQALVIGYVLITGELSRALQVALFGLAGGGHAAPQGKRRSSASFSSTPRFGLAATSMPAAAFHSVGVGRR